MRAIFRGSSEAQQGLIRKQADALGLEDLLVEVLAEPDEWDEGGRMKAEGTIYWSLVSDGVGKARRDCDVRSMQALISVP